MASTTLVAAATLAARGSGGRSSVSGITATVFGSTGFLGRYVTNQLGRIGSQVTAPYRGDELNTRHLKLMGDLGQVVPFPFELRDEDSVYDAISSSSTVINLIGKHHHTLNYTYEDVHIKGTETLLEQAMKCNVEHFIHVSALPPLDASCKSKWLATKLQSEQLVKDAFPNSSTIIRPAPMFGAEDRLFTRMAQNITQGGLAVVPNFGEAKLQPVWVNDVASVIVAVARDSEKYVGKTLELAGPDVVSVKDLYLLISEEIKRRVTVLPAPTAIMYQAARLLNMRTPFVLPNPPYSADQLLYEVAEPVLDTSKQGVLRFADLDAIALSIHSDIFKETLRRFRRGGDRSSLFYVD